MDGKRPTIASLHGMVTAAHPLAAQAGAKLLAGGGNAFDAAAATAAALAVVEPAISGLAGLGVASCYIGAEQRLRTLDFASRAPPAAPAGAVPCAAPGNLAGWCELARAHGRRKLHDIFAPAVALARDGHPLIGYAAASLHQAALAQRDRPGFADWCGAYLGHGSGPGDLLRQPDLARSFELIASEGPEHFTRGALARRVIAQVQALGGGLTAAELAAANPVWQEPLTAAYRGLQLHAPHNDGWRLLLALRILDGFDLASMEHDGAAELDTLWRALRLAAAAPGDDLSDTLVQTQRARLRDPYPLETAMPPDPCLTSSFAVVDREGNAVCVSQSLGGRFGSFVVVPGTGICLNNFSRADRRSTGLAPLIATLEGKPVLLLGSAGGDSASLPQLQVLVQHLDHHLPIQDAIEAPRVRLDEGQRVLAERRTLATTVEALRRHGHALEAMADWAVPVGAVQAIAIDPRTGIATGGADPRRDGYVAIP